MKIKGIPKRFPVIRYMDRNSYNHLKKFDNHFLIICLFVLPFYDTRYPDTYPKKFHGIFYDDQLLRQNGILTKTLCNSVTFSLDQLLLTVKFITVSSHVSMAVAKREYWPISQRCGRSVGENTDFTFVTVRIM